MPRETVVIGGGLGGIAAAIRLRLAGRPVRLLEKNERLGGRCNVHQDGGFTFDTGPTLLLMRDVFATLFQDAGRRLEDYLDLIRLNPNYRITFGDGTALEISGDVDHVAAQMEGIERGAGDGFRRYLADAGEKYRISRAHFVERNFYHWHEFFTPTNLRQLLATNALRPLSRHVSRYVRDPRLQLALTFQTMYLGLAPHQAPSVYSLLPYTEIVEGIWYPCGGMYRVTEALTRLACELGVEIETNTAVRRVQKTGRRVTAVVTDRRSYDAGVVLCNADLPYASKHLFNITRRRHLDPGSSALLLYLGLDRRYPLPHHSVFLARDPNDNFDAIFKRHEVPADPSLYVCAPAATDPGLAPPNSEPLYILVPVPSLNGQVNWSQEAPRLRERVLDRLEASGLPNLRRHIVTERFYSPQDFVDDYNIDRGSAFGLSHALHQVGYFRPSNRAPGYDNLYFVGAGTVPGGGMPMVLLGARLAVERIGRDHG